jgi:hypothetical protein
MVALVALGPFSSPKKPEERPLLVLGPRVTAAFFQRIAIIRQSSRPDRQFSSGFQFVMREDRKCANV